jgi:hypothetical protein
MIDADQRVHHVERGDAAGAGEAVAIDLEQGVTEMEKGKGLRKGRDVLPVDRDRAGPPWREDTVPLTRRPFLRRVAQPCLQQELNTFLGFNLLTGVKRLSRFKYPILDNTLKIGQL